RSRRAWRFARRVGDLLVPSPRLGRCGAASRRERAGVRRVGARERRARERLCAASPRHGGRTRPATRRAGCGAADRSAARVRRASARHSRAGKSPHHRRPCSAGPPRRPDQRRQRVDRRRDAGRPAASRAFRRDSQRAAHIRNVECDRSDADAVARRRLAPSDGTPGRQHRHAQPRVHDSSERDLVAGREVLRRPRRRQRRREDDRSVRRRTLCDDGSPVVLLRRHSRTTDTRATLRAAATRRGLPRPRHARRDRRAELGDREPVVRSAKSRRRPRRSRTNRRRRPVISRLFTATVLTVASLGASVRVAAQQTDVIRGQVTSTSGAAPIYNASVVATSATRGVSRSAKTGRDGRYTITFPGGEGDYFLSVTAIGYAPRRFELRRAADEDILIGDAQLAPASAALDTVVTVGKRARPTPDNGAPDVGGGDRPVNMGLVPAEQLGSLASMAASTPGVLFVQGVDGDPSGYSLLGLDGSQNGLAINGMSSSAADLPRDADVSVTLATSPYDVSQGQFSGGRLNVRLPSGSNYVTSTSSLRLNAPPLEWTDAAGRALGQRFTDANLGGAFAGPISLDQAFYNFSYQLGRRGNDLQTLLNTRPLGLETEGIAADSVARLLQLLGGAGVPPTVDRFPSHRLGDQGL